jgi:hypothetical protein
MIGLKLISVALTLYMDFRDEFMAIFPHLVVNVKLLASSLTYYGYNGHNET